MLPESLQSKTSTNDIFYLHQQHTTHQPTTVVYPSWHLLYFVWLKVFQNTFPSPEGNWRETGPWQSCYPCFRYKEDTRHWASRVLLLVNTRTEIHTSCFLWNLQWLLLLSQFQKVLNSLVMWRLFKANVSLDQQFIQRQRLTRLFKTFLSILPWCHYTKALPFWIPYNTC